MNDPAPLIHTADLDVPARRALRALLDTVFGDDMSDDDWEHALGGLHAVVHDGGLPVAHASLVQRRLLHGGRALRTGYVEAVAVHPAYRRRGLGGMVMAPLERVVRAAHDVGALGASDMARPFYAARGWRVWHGPLGVLTPSGIVDTPDEAGGVHVLPSAATLDPRGALVCDWRDGAVW